MHDIFRKIAHKVGNAMGSPLAFVGSTILVLIWAVTGPYFHFSDTWQLVINTGTTVLTFLMVFLIQNMQNRDAKAIHLKLDELIRSVKEARNSLVDLEDMTDEEMDDLEKEFRTFRTEARNIQRGQKK